MRGPSLLLAALLVALAGCSSGPSLDPTTSTDPQPPAGKPTAPPAAIHVSETVTGSADPMNYALFPPCTTPSAKCFEYPFTAEVKFQIDAKLSWGLEASDFDLFLFNDSEAVAASGSAPPSKEERIQDAFPAGNYRILVVAWEVTQDTFTLDATFH